MREAKSGLYWMLAGVLVFTPLGFMSKENAVLVPAMMLILEFTLFRFRTANPADRKILFVFFAVTLVIPFLVLAYMSSDMKRVAFRIRREKLQSVGTLADRGPRPLVLSVPDFFPVTGGIWAVSRRLRDFKGLLQPVETLFAVVGVLFLLGAALFDAPAASGVCLRNPVFSRGTQPRIERFAPGADFRASQLSALAGTSPGGVLLSDLRATHAEADQASR